jgi:hypothetical protein
VYRSSTGVYSYRRCNLVVQSFRGSAVTRGFCKGTRIFQWYTVTAVIWVYTGTEVVQGYTDTGLVQGYRSNSVLQQ